MSEYQEPNGVDAPEEEEKKYRNILDNLTEHRADRAQKLLKNLPNEDLVHIDPRKIPAFLRIDLDIKKKTDALKKCHQDYMEFNIDDLSREVTLHLKNQVEQVSDDFKLHRANVANRLQDGNDTNQKCLKLQDETVSMRIEQNQKITDAMTESSSQLHDFEVQNQEKDALRAKLVQALKYQRETDISLSKDQLAYDNLKNVQRAETELRKRRDAQETEILQEAARTQNSSLTWTENCSQEIKNQDAVIQNMTKTLKDTMDKRQRTNVQRLLQAIEHDMSNNQAEIRELNDQMRELDGSYQKYRNANQRIQMELPRLQDSTLVELHKDESEAQASLTQQVQQLEDKIKQQSIVAQESVKQINLTQKELKDLRDKADTLSTKIDIAKSINVFYESLKYPQRIQELKRFGIQANQEKAADLEKQIAEMSSQWTTMYEAQQTEIRRSIEDASQKQLLTHIQMLVSDINEKEVEITDIQGEIDQILSEQPSKIDDDQLESLKLAVQKKVTEYKLRLNDKAACFEEMYAKALLLINSDKQIIENQEEIMQLKHEIDVNILEIEQKSAIITELQEELIARKETYRQLKREIREVEDQCEELQLILKQKEEELETLEDVLRDKEVIIEGLEKTLGEKAPVLTMEQRFQRPEPQMPVKKKQYAPVNNDPVDELLAKYINTMTINVPIRKIEGEQGFYMFGTRKIYAKVMNNKLVVRVGGGYMSFQEFIDTYGHQELKRINELIAAGEWDPDEMKNGKEDSPEKRRMTGKGSLSPGRAGSRGGRASPNAGRKSPSNFRF